MDERKRGNDLFASGDLDGALEAWTAGIALLERIAADELSLDERAALVALYCNASHVTLRQGAGARDAAMAAESLANAAIALDEWWSKAYVRRAAALSALKQHQFAIDDLRRAISIDPSLRAAAEPLIRDAEAAMSSSRRHAGYKPNAWTAAQSTFQRELNSPYVLALPRPGNDRRVRPSLSNESPETAIRCAPSLTHPLAEVYLSALWRDASETGSHAAVHALYAAVVKEASLVASHEETFRVSDSAIVAQIRLEFPHIEDPTAPPAAIAFKRLTPASDATRVTLIQSWEAKEAGRVVYPGRPRWLEWPKAFHAVNRALGGNALIRLDDIMTAHANLNGQRALDDNMYRLQHAYDGKRQQAMSVAQHLKVHRACGYRIGTSLPRDRVVTYEALHGHPNWEQYPPPPSPDSTSRDHGPPVGAAANDPPLPASQLTSKVPRNCEGCGASLHLVSDPCECQCGEQYCSAECHERDWHEGHRRTCDVVAEAQHGALTFTRRYWNHVMTGLLPDFHVVDFVGVWRRRWGIPILGTKEVLDGPTEPSAGITAVDRGTFSAATLSVQSLPDELLDDRVGFAQAELAFYHAFERPYMAERVGYRQDAFKVAVARNQQPLESAPLEENAGTTSSGVDAAHRFDPIADFLGELIVQRCRMATPHAFDSLARLVYKRGICTVFEPIEAAIPAIRDPMYTRDKISRAYETAITQASRREGVPASALGPYQRDPTINVRGAGGIFAGLRRASPIH